MVDPGAFTMGIRPSSELIQSLRVTLQKLEQALSSPEDANCLAEIKRILLIRIANLEATEALKDETTIPETLGLGLL